MSLVERAKCLNTLACFLKGLQGQITKIELRNECSVVGHIVSVDSAMSTHLTDVTFTSLFGKVTKFDSFFVQGKNIRYVHIPDDVDIMKTVQTEIDKLLGVRNYQSTRKPKRLSKWTMKLNKERAERRKQMIDIGSGKGYLGSHLALKHGLKVLGIDSSSSNTEGATGRSQRLGKQWNGLVKRSKQRKKLAEKDIPIDPANGSTEKDTALKRTLQSHIDKAQGTFVAITQFVDKTSNLQELISKHLQTNSSPESNYNGVTKNRMESDVGQHDLKQSFLSSSTSLLSDERQSKMVGLSSTALNPSMPYMMGGLHACGDLTSSTLRLFLDSSSARVLCNVGCCYHHLTEAFVCCPFGTSNNVSSEDSGFPLSSYLRVHGCQLGRNARMLASQAPDRLAQNGKLPGVSLFWRALLQVILRDLTGEVRDDWQVGKIAAKCDTFPQYVHKALSKLGFDDQLSDEEILDYEHKYECQQARIQCFVQLKAALAPVVEALILLDRMYYLLEQDIIADVHLVQAFDPVTSPRCYALVAWKS